MTGKSRVTARVTARVAARVAARVVAGLRLCIDECFVLSWITRGLRLCITAGLRECFVLSWITRGRYICAHVKTYPSKYIPLSTPDKGHTRVIQGSSQKGHTGI